MCQWLFCHCSALYSCDRTRGCHYVTEDEVTHYLGISIHEFQSARLRNGKRCRRSTCQVQPLGYCINFPGDCFLLHISSLAAACRGEGGARSSSAERAHDDAAFSVGLRALTGRPAAAGLGAGGSLAREPSNKTLSGSTYTQSESSESSAAGFVGTTGASPVLLRQPGQSQQHVTTISRQAEWGCFLAYLVCQV
jgi:hypothetical protein